MLRNIFGRPMEFGDYTKMVDSFVLQGEQLKNEYERIVNRNGVFSTNIFKNKAYLGKFLICIFIMIAFPITGLIDLIILNKATDGFFRWVWGLGFCFCVVVGVYFLSSLIKDWFFYKKIFKEDVDRVTDSYVYAINSMECVASAFFERQGDFNYPKIEDNNQAYIDKIFGGLEELEFDLVDPQRIYFKNSELLELPDSKDRIKAKKELFMYFLKQKEKIKEQT